jgi:hypothetical protein
MAIGTLGAFVGGLAAGWVARGLVDAPRTELVNGVAKTYGIGDAVRRWVAERREWVEDLIAEGHAQYEATRRRAPWAADEEAEGDLS